MSLLTRINRSYGLQTDSIVSLEVGRVYFCACCMFGDDLTSFECDLEIHLLGGGLIFAHRRMKAPFGNYAQRLFRQGRAIECAPFSYVHADTFLLQFLPGLDSFLTQRILIRSEERRVGKECRSRWS